MPGVFGEDEGSSYLEFSTKMHHEHYLNMQMRHSCCESYDIRKNISFTIKE